MLLYSTIGTKEDMESHVLVVGEPEVEPDPEPEPAEGRTLATTASWQDISYSRQGGPFLEIHYSIQALTALFWRAQKGLRGEQILP